MFSERFVKGHLASCNKNATIKLCFSFYEAQVHANIENTWTRVLLFHFYVLQNSGIHQTTVYACAHVDMENRRR